MVCTTLGAGHRREDVLFRPSLAQVRLTLHQDLCYRTLPGCVTKGPVFPCPGLHRLKRGEETATVRPSSPVVAEAAISVKPVGLLVGSNAVGTMHALRVGEQFVLEENEMSRRHVYIIPQMSSLKELTFSC